MKERKWKKKGKIKKSVKENERKKKNTKEKERKRKKFFKIKENRIKM